MLSWFSRLTTSVLLAVVCFRPHQDYLHLSYYPTSYRTRIYFSLSLALELSVRRYSFTSHIHSENSRTTTHRHYSDLAMCYDYNILLKFVSWRRPVIDSPPPTPPSHLRHRQVHVHRLPQDHQQNRTYSLL